MFLTKSALQKAPKEIRKLIKLFPDVLFLGCATLSCADSAVIVNEKKAMIVLGLDSYPLRVITVALHELGHYKAGIGNNVLLNELRAWKWAKQYAKENNLPFSDFYMKNCLASYERDSLGVYWNERYWMFPDFLRERNNE